MQQAVPRDDNDAIPLWERYLSDELPRMVLALCGEHIQMSQRRLTDVNGRVHIKQAWFFALSVYTCYLFVLGCS